MKCPRCCGTGKVMTGGELAIGNIAKRTPRVERWCDLCDGTGKVKHVKSESTYCGNCNGNGHIEKTKDIYKEFNTGRKVVIDTKKWTETCSRCNGSGNGKPNEYYKPDYSSGACFITTSVCKTLKLQDDNEILNTFRYFRDSWLVNQKNGINEINEYYNKSPVLVKKIEKNKNKYDISIYLWSMYLKKAYAEINNNNNQKAYLIYKSMLNWLEENMPK